MVVVGAHCAWPLPAGLTAFGGTGSVVTSGTSTLDGPPDPVSPLDPLFAAQPASTTASAAALAIVAMRLALATLTSSHLHPPGDRLAEAPPPIGARHSREK
ncbi:hypothetical protein PSU4_37030 [Pseudonocardia sulfidoxydans NBRC 16205]|uniref:Uncharacterized protein n=1 Tax=Pseudonocardia sulfidoxydans NBRC 16205 TaxID=1223511 RepID=A0A511DIV8_9PSEU|nr:hypothetical protein PSU4_37030 [Pseudonocardia sulfidoxydans NBRC 16205]